MKTLRTVACCLLIAAGINTMYAQTPPVAAPDQLALLKSPDPKLAANKKLVFDMYRTIVNGGHYEMADKFFTPGYIQHNPNVATGRQALVEYIKKTRPVRAIPDLIGFPVISIMAEGDMVLVASVEYANDPEKPGAQFTTTHFDMYRIEKGLIAEHWDNLQKSKSALTTDPNVTNRPSTSTKPAATK
jgi:predicted SnoaL-like aldol condensation-catalyzing enzyme